MADEVVILTDSIELVEKLQSREAMGFQPIADLGDGLAVLGAAPWVVSSLGYFRTIVFFTFRAIPYVGTWYMINTTTAHVDSIVKNATEVNANTILLEEAKAKKYEAMVPVIALIVGGLLIFSNAFGNLRRALR